MDFFLEKRRLPVSVLVTPALPTAVFFMGAKLK